VITRPNLSPLVIKREATVIAVKCAAAVFPVSVIGHLMPVYLAFDLALYKASLSLQRFGLERGAIGRGKAGDKLFIAQPTDVILKFL
jgi:hypothetical protein